MVAREGNFVPETNGNVLATWRSLLHKLTMLSQKTRYTIRALMHLADKYQQGLVPLAEIAEAQNIPAKFLTVILSEMSRAGIVVSQRGRDRGYELALAR